MEDNNLLIEIFTQIETMEEFEKVCGSFNFLLKLEVIPPTRFLAVISQMTFRKLNNLNNHGD